MIDLMAYLGGSFLMVCYLPQIVRTWRTKKVEDLSMWMIVLTLGSAVFYEIYASMLDLIPVIVMNGVFLVLVFIQLLLKLVFDRRVEASLAP